MNAGDMHMLADDAEALVRDAQLAVGVATHLQRAAHAFVVKRLVRKVQCE